MANKEKGHCSDVQGENWSRGQEWWQTQGFPSFMPSLPRMCSSKDAWCSGKHFLYESVSQVKAITLLCCCFLSNTGPVSNRNSQAHQNALHPSLGVWGSRGPVQLQGRLGSRAVFSKGIKVHLLAETYILAQSGTSNTKASASPSVARLGSRPVHSSPTDVGLVGAVCFS